MEGEQFSLCWNNFHNNLSSGFHSLLQDEDLVDVTLAADGRYIKAHKTVLSVCSPYFKELFRVNPCKHPIVILQDVNYGALNNLLHFMYQGEVSVSQDEISTFMKVAEMLKVKGLTENTSMDRNGLENDTCRSIPHMYGESKPQMMRRRPVKKLIKPIQHLRPIESLKTASSPPATSSPQPPPQKKLHIESVSPRNSDTTEPLIHPKEEPVEATAEEPKDQMYDNRMDMGSVVHHMGGEPSLQHHHLPVSWKPDLNISTDTSSSSPGTLQCILGRRGNPRLIVDGHVFFKKSTYKGKSFWYCKNSRSSYKCQAVCWTLNGNIVKWPTGHSHGLIPDLFNPEEDTEVPIEQLQQVLIQSA